MNYKNFIVVCNTCFQFFLLRNWGWGWGGEGITLNTNVASKQSLLISSLDLTVYATWFVNHKSHQPHYGSLIVSKLLLLSRLLPYAVTLSTVVKYQVYKSLEINFYRRLYLLLPKILFKGLSNLYSHWLRKAAKNITSFFGAVRILTTWCDFPVATLVSLFLLFHSFSMEETKLLPHGTQVLRFLVPFSVSLLRILALQLMSNE